MNNTQILVGLDAETYNLFRDVMVITGMPKQVHILRAIMDCSINDWYELEGICEHDYTRVVNTEPKKIVKRLGVGIDDEDLELLSSMALKCGYETIPLLVRRLVEIHCKEYIIEWVKEEQVLGHGC